MPNQTNFRSDVLNKTESRFLASRIVKLPSEQIFLQEIPASFGYDDEDNIEIHFYTKTTNVLVTSFVTKLSDGVVKLHIVAYDDGTYKNYLQIDFTKLFDVTLSTVIPGDYKVTINFFSDEIGSYRNRILSITQISPSRTEIEVGFNNSVDQVNIEQNQTLLNEFVFPSFTKADAIGVMKKVLTDGVESNDDTEGLTATNVINQSSEFVQNNINRLNVLGLDEQFKNALNAYFPKLFENIREKIVIGDERVQSAELESFIRNELERTFQELQVSMDTRVSLS